jgi:ABC-type glycerol-3-phosphate transport system permease component
MRVFIQEIPHRSEAALIDGCSRYQAFGGSRSAAPAGLAATTVIVFMFA